MRRAQRKIVYLMLAVLLATVLSPSFGWEAMASQSAHEHEMLAMDDRDGHDGAPHHEDEDSHHHHGCAGHLLGHMPAQLGEAFVFAAPEPKGNIFPDLAPGFASRFPDRLDRPPLAPALA